MFAIPISFAESPQSWVSLRSTQPTTLRTAFPHPPAVGWDEAKRNPSPAAGRPGRRPAPGVMFAIPACHAESPLSWVSLRSTQPLIARVNPHCFRGSGAIGCAGSWTCHGKTDQSERPAHDGSSSRLGFLPEGADRGPLTLSHRMSSRWHQISCIEHLRPIALPAGRLETTAEPRVGWRLGRRSARRKKPVTLVAVPVSTHH